MTATAKGKKTRRKKAAKTGSVSSWRTSTWIGLTIIVSIWMFVFGILVGRGTVSSQFNFKNTKKELYAQAEKADRTVKKPSLVEESVEKTASGPFEGQKKTDRGASSDEAPFTQQTPPKLKKKEPLLKRPEKGNQAKIALTPKRKTKSTPAATRPAPKKFKQKPIAHSYQTIQVAAMRSLTEAKRMVARLRHKGYPAYLASAAVSGKGMTHRVRIGPYKSEVKANNALSRLKKQGIDGLLLGKR